MASRNGYTSLVKSMPRSEPLVLGKDGEPTNPPFTYEKYESWKVVVVDQETEKRRSKKFFSYVEAQEKAVELRERFGDRAEVGIVSRQVGYGPPASKVSDEKLLTANERGYYWCPYCRKFRDFPYFPSSEGRACEFCFTPEQSFHVVACNPTLWNPVHYRRVFGGA